MIVVGKICGYTPGSNRLLCVLVDSFNFLGSNDVSQPAPLQTYKVTTPITRKWRAMGQPGKSSLALF